MKSTYRGILATPTARLRRPMGQDDGTSLIELMVGMMLMLVFMGMFTGAVVMMNSAMNKAQAVNSSSSQLNVVFSNLDKTVRYAAAIGTPYPIPNPVTPTAWYVEMRINNPQTGVEGCTQLRVSISDHQLRSRAWINDVNGVVDPSTLTNWLPISSNISNGDAVAPSIEFLKPLPFVLVPATGNTVLQKLTINLVSPSGSGTSLTNSRSTFTFTALNSANLASTASICPPPPP